MGSGGLGEQGRAGCLPDPYGSLRQPSVLRLCAPPSPSPSPLQSPPPNIYNRLRAWDWHLTVRGLLLLLLAALPLHHAHRALAGAGAAAWRRRALMGAGAAWLCFLYAFWAGLGRFLPADARALPWVAQVCVCEGGLDLLCARAVRGLCV